MNVLLTGATGYIGKRLLPVLLEAGHSVWCCVRDLNRFNEDLRGHERVHLIEVDFLSEPNLSTFPDTIDVAYYLIHSMTASTTEFDHLEAKSAETFRQLMVQIGISQVIYLSGISNSDQLSKHLASRRNVEALLTSPHYALTVLRAGIITGSGSASFEIIRDLTEKLPIMITPKWVMSRCQPIAVTNVIEFLIGVMRREETYHQTFDIGGPEILTYKEMLLQYAAVRGLKRWIITVPVMTPRLSSYWLYFVTAVSYPLAVNLVNSMKHEVICQPNDLAERLGVDLISYSDAIRRAFMRIEQNLVVSSWSDAINESTINPNIARYIDIPRNGCYQSVQYRPIRHVESVRERVWAIGGETGWYYANWLWQIRGVLDKMVGGVGLRRGRRDPQDIRAGDSIDFWRVLLADRSQFRLLLYAEMRLTGEAWLEFRKNSHNELVQTATFRPKGLIGRLYWYLVSPFHLFIFNGMINQICYGARK